MIASLVSGVLIGSVKRKITKGDYPYLSFSVSTRDYEAGSHIIFMTCFDETLFEEILSWNNKERVSVACEISIKQSDRMDLNGNSQISHMGIVHGVLSVYHVKRKRNVV